MESFSRLSFWFSHGYYHKRASPKLSAEVLGQADICALNTEWAGLLSPISKVHQDAIH